MREIKSRAWDKKNKEMYNNVCFDADYYAPRQLKSPEIDSLHFIKYDDCELMQYTGLKDKNGKEIYEGDILKYWYDRDKTGDSRVEFTEIVEFEEMAEYNGWSFHKNLNPEVIGNIYENKEEL